MSTDTQSLTFQEVIQAEAKDIYHAFTNTAMLNQWLCNDSRINASEGGRIYFYWNQGYYTVGEFTDVVENESLAFTWRGKGETAVTNVAITLQPNGSSTQLSLSHNGLGTGDDWSPTITELKSGWETGLANLKSVLEKGLDKRIYDQPLMGVLPSGQLNKEQAEEIGLPVAGGVRISGTVPNTGAAKAGLQNEDIITKIDDTDITGFASFAPAVAGKKAGDEVTMTYYRGTDKQTITLPLSGRPTPNVPATAVAFAEQLQQLQVQMDGQLDEALDGVTDEVASTAAKEGEWTVKQILAHLILVERGQHYSIGVQVSNQALSSFVSNATPSTNALLATYPTLDELVQLWKRAEAETVALIANLPDDFVARKVDYLNVGNTLLFGLPFHTGNHIRQIQQVVEAVQKK